ncbi:MAG: hypothetical protein WDM80_10360 [Limisphaerales bacterium]
MSGGFGKLLLGLQACGTGAAFPRQHGTEGIFKLFVMMGELPRFHRPQHHGQAGHFAERTFVVLVNFRANQRFNQMFGHNRLLSFYTDLNLPW